jgi:hypothetical protein
MLVPSDDSSIESERPASASRAERAGTGHSDSIFSRSGMMGFDMGCFLQTSKMGLPEN